MAISSSSSLVLKLRGSIDGGANWADIATLTKPGIAWTKIVVNIPAMYKVDTARFGIEVTATYGSYDVWLDKFVIEEAPTPLAGVYTINPGAAASGTNFQTFTAAINALNNAGISATTTFNVSDDAVFTEEVPAITATGTSVNQIYFQRTSTGTNRPVVKPTTGVQGIKIVGGDYITFNGIDIMVASGSIPNYGYYVTNASATNGAQYNTIKNCKITLNKTNTSTKGIYQYYTVTTTHIDGAESNNTYQNLAIENCATGIYLYGGSSTYPDVATTITGCTIGGATAGDMGGTSYGYGIYSYYYQKDLTITNNEIRNFSAASTIYGIYMYSTYTYGNVTISGNKIHDLVATGTSTTYPVYGMYVSLASGTNTAKVYNNMLWNLTGPNPTTGSSAYAAYGIYNAGATSTNTYNYDFNTVALTGPVNANSVCFYNAAVTAVNKMRNNVFANLTPNQTGTPKHYCYYSSSATALGATNSISNNNVLYVANTGQGYIGKGSSTDYATITSWSTAMVGGNDSASRPTNPQFVSSNSVFIQTGISTPVSNNGSYFSGTSLIDWVTTDITGDTRNGSTPDIGADEGAFTNETLCVRPTAAPTALTLLPYPTAITGSFTASVPAADNYLVVKSTQPLDGIPQDYTLYTAGQVIGTTGTVVGMSGTSFSATGLTSDVEYIFTIFSVNTSGLQAPLYYTSATLSGTLKTMPTAAPLIPGTLTATAVSASQINLAATANAAGDNILVAWNTTASFGTPSPVGYTLGATIAGAGTGTVLYFGPAAGLANHTPLSSFTTYYYQAWSYTSANRTTYYNYSTTAKTANAITLPEPQAVPYSQGFETVDAPATPAWPYGWLQIGAKWNPRNAAGSYGETARTGFGYAANTYSSTTAEFLVSTPLVLTGGQSYDFSTYYKGGAYAGYTSFKMYIGTAPTTAGLTTQIAGVTWNPANAEIPTVYTQLAGSYVAPTTGTYYIGFQVISSSTPWYMSMDDFSVSLTPPMAMACSNPSPASPSSNQARDVNLAWTNNGTVNSVEIYFGENQALVTSMDASVRIATLTSPTPLTSYDLPLLNYGSTYYWQLLPKNGEGTPATGTSVWTFGTLPDPNIYALPYAESFDGVTAPAFPAGWTKLGTGTAYTQTTTPYAGTNCVYIYSSGSTYVATLTLPVVTLDRDKYIKLSLYGKANSSTGGKLKIGYLTNPSDVATFVSFGSLTMSSTTYTLYSQSLGLLTASTPRTYAIQADYSPAYSILFDSVSLEEMTFATDPNPVTIVSPADDPTHVLSVTIPTTLNWAAAGGDPTDYDVYFGVTLPASPNANVVGTSWNPGALSYSTNYLWKVVAHNPHGYATGSLTWTFRTMDDPTIYVTPTTPYVQDFAGATFPPTNFTRLNGLYGGTYVAGTQWVQDDWLNVTTPTNKAAKINIYGTVCYGWLITPPVNIPATGYELKFDMGLVDWGDTFAPEAGEQADDKLIVVMSDSPTMSAPTIIREWNNTTSPYVYDAIPATGATYTIPLTGISGTKYFALYGESTVTGGDNDLMVDNLIFRQTPTGVPDYVTLTSPANNATTVNPANVVLTWTPAITGGNADFYQVFVGAEPINPGSAYYGENYYETTNTNLNLSAQEDITIGYSQDLYWAVWPVNGNPANGPDLEGPGFMKFKFTTIADPRIISLPYTQNFDGVTTPNFPLAWTAYKSNSSSSLYTTTTSHTAPNSVYMYNYTTSETMRLITPEVTVPMNSFKVSFYAKGGSAGYTLKVGTVSALDGTGVFTQVASITLTAAFAQYSVSFDGYAGSDHYICFQHGLASTYQSLYVDTVLIEQLMANDMAATLVAGPGIGVAGDQLTYNVTVMNNGTASQSSYNVYLKKLGDARIATLAVNTPLAAGASVVHTLNWTPTTTGIYSIVGEVGLTGDMYAGNNESAAISTNVYAAGTYLPMVGDIASTTTAYYTPLDMFYKNSMSETIYLAHEMQATAGTINAIIYQNNFSQNITKPIKIWMKHTTEANVATAFLPFTGYQLVFDGSVYFPMGVNAVVINLDTPFVYTGGNLAVRAYSAWEDFYFTTADKFYYTASPEYPNRTRYYQADLTSAFDPILLTDYLGAAFTGTLMSNIANTAFVMNPATPITALATPVATVVKTGTNAVLNWAAIPGAYAYKIYASDDPSNFSTTPLATVYTNTYTAALGTNLKKFYKVVAVSYHHTDRELVLNPAAAIGFDNSKVIAAPYTRETKNKD
jgi:hypothetical protein